MSDLSRFYKIVHNYDFRLPLSEDPALAMAFAVARRAAAVPLLLINGTYRKTVRTYLDSSILQYQLQRLNKHGSLKGHPYILKSCFIMPFEYVGFLTITKQEKTRIRLKKTLY